MKGLILKIFHNCVNVRYILLFIIFIAILHSLVQHGVPPTVADRNHFLQWVDCIGKILMANVPVEGTVLSSHAMYMHLTYLRRT